MIRSALWSALLVAIAAVSALAAPDKVDLRYRPQVGQEVVYVLKGQTTEVAMAGSPMGITGGVRLDLTSKIVEVGENDFLQELLADNIQADLNGEIQQPPAPPPMKVKMTFSGELLDVEAPEAPVEVFSTGGAPVPLLTVALGFSPFKGEPVGLEETWNTTARAALGTFGDLELKSESKVVEITDDHAKIVTKLDATIPEFSIPNPFAPGASLAIMGGTLKMAEMTRLLDYHNGRLLSSAGEMVIELQIDLTGTGEPVPVTLTLDAELKEKKLAAEGTPEEGQGKEQ